MCPYMNNKNIIIEISAADCALPRVFALSGPLRTDFLRKLVTFCASSWFLLPAK